jgi:hypothetical protein
MTLGRDLLLFHLHIVGVLMAVLVVVNLTVPRVLHWREDIVRLSLVNRQIFQVHAAFIILVLALFSALLLICGDTLLEPSRLSRAVLVGLTIFWTLRMLVQWCFYSPAVWRGDRFKTAMHYVFSLAWVYITTTFAASLWGNVSGLR